MRAISLNSGSNGNCFYFETCHTKIIVEAGLTCRQYENRLSEINVNPEEIDAILITHEHCDHISGAGVISRKYHTPVYMTHQTYAAMTHRVGVINTLHLINQGEIIDVNEVSIYSIVAQHDCAGGVHYIISSDDKKIGVFTDVGGPNSLLHAAFSTLDAVFLESNYDPNLLRQSRYPDSLKRRISGGRGHLSNLQSAQIVRYYAGEQLKNIVLCHVSEQANSYQHVLSCHRKIHQGNYSLSIAPRDGIGEWVDLMNISKCN